MSLAVEVVLPGIERLVARDGAGRIANGYLLGDLLVDPAVADHTHGPEMLAYLAGRTLRAILVTHRHFDHTRGVAALASRIGVPITWPETLRDGDDWHGWRVLHTPGHAADHLCLLWRDVLVAADMLGGDGWPVLIPEQGGDLETYRASAKRLRTLRLSVALPGHGAPIHDVDRALAEAERRAA